MTVPKEISKYFSELGKKARGDKKRRGDSEYYSNLLKRIWAKRKAKMKESPSK